MASWFLKVGAVTALVVLAFGPASEAQTTISRPLIADASLCTGWNANNTAAHTNYGGSSAELFQRHLQIGFDRLTTSGGSSTWGYSYPLGFCTALMRFDLSGIPSNATVVSAGIYLSMKGHVGTMPSGGFSIRARRVTAAWNEYTVTGANQPASTQEATDTYPPTGFRRVYFNLTALIQGWVAGTVANHGVIVERTDLSQDFQVYFESRENTGDFKPYLSVTYTVPCSYSVSPTSIPAIVAGQPATVTVTTGSGCSWTASSSVSWIRITSGASGSGSGTVQLTIDPNPTGVPRSGSVTVAGVQIPVTQAYCTVSFSPTSSTADPNGTNGSTALQAPSGCPWTVSSDSSWLTVTSSSSGNGGSSVTYSVAPNAGGARTGRITASTGAVFTVGQESATATLTATIRTQSGGDIAGATVEVTPTGGTLRSCVTGNDGRCQVSNMPVGPYTAQARRAGFSNGSHSGTLTTGGGTMTLALASRVSVEWLGVTPTIGAAGQTLVLRYRISNADTQDVTVYLGAEMFPASNPNLSYTYPADDRMIQLPAGSPPQEYVRDFVLPLTAPDGQYDLLWGVWGTKTTSGTFTTRFGLASVQHAYTQGAGPPVVTSFAINGGAQSTTSRTVTLNNTATNSPTEYQASELGHFQGASWNPYSPAPSFTISSAGSGTKTVYFRVRNAAGGSDVVQDTIQLQDQAIPTRLSLPATIHATVDAMFLLQTTLDRQLPFLQWEPIANQSIRFELFDDWTNRWVSLTDTNSPCPPVCGLPDLTTVRQTTSDSGNAGLYVVARYPVGNTYRVRAVFDGTDTLAPAQVESSLAIARANHHVIGSNYTINGHQKPWIAKDVNGHEIRSLTLNRSNSRLPLVLVHGNNNEEADKSPAPHRWGRLLQHIRDNPSEFADFEVYVWVHDTSKAVGFNGNTGNASELGDFVNNYLMNHHVMGTKALFIAHSRGGLVVRSFMKLPQNDARTLGLISIATPHHGSPGAVPDWAADSWARVYGSTIGEANKINLLYGPDGYFSGWAFDTDRLGDVSLAWDNADSAIATTLQTRFAGVWWAVGNEIAVSLNDMNVPRTGESDLTAFMSGRVASMYGTLHELNASVDYSKVFAIGAFDDDFLDTPIDLVGWQSWTEHAKLSLATQLMAVLFRATPASMGGSNNYLANDGMVPLQSALALEMSTSVVFADVSGVKVTPRWQAIRHAAQQAGLRGFLAFTNNVGVDSEGMELTLPVWARVEDHLHVLDTLSTAYWARIGTEARRFVADSQCLAPPIRVQSLTPSLSSPRAAGTTVTWTAQACGATNLEYKFFLYDVLTGQWSTLRDWGLSNQAPWVPALAGTYRVQVWVRRVGSTAAQEAWLNGPDFVVTGGPARLLSLTASPPGPVSVGTPVTWTASAVGCASPSDIRYRFLLYHVETGQWSTLRDWGSSNQAPWIPALAGTYRVQVWARCATSTEPWQSHMNGPTVTVTGGPASLLSVTASPPGPVSVGTPVSWTASAAGCAAPADIRYRFMLYDVLTGQWTTLQDWGPSNQAPWQPSLAGTYRMQVWVRCAASTAPYQDWRNSANLTVTGGPARLISVTPSPVGPVPVETTVTWTASAIGCASPADIRYRFLVYDVLTQTWARHEWGTGSTLPWTSSLAGIYRVQVWARCAGSTEAWQSWVNSPNVTVTGGPARLISVTPSPAGSVAVGTPVLWTASAVGCTPQAPPHYRFLLYNVGAQQWTTLREYSTLSTAPWTPTQPGTYRVQAWARCQGSSASWESWQNSPNVGVVASLTSDEQMSEDLEDDSVEEPPGQMSLLVSDATGLRLTDLQGVEHRRFELGYRPGPFAVSDDRTTIAYCHGTTGFDNAIGVYDVASGLTVATVNAPWCSSLRWLPGSATQLVYAQGDGHLHVLDLIAGETSIWQRSDFLFSLAQKGAFVGGVDWDGALSRLVFGAGWPEAGGLGVFAGTRCEVDAPERICAPETLSNPAGSASGWHTIAFGPAISRDGRFAVYLERRDPTLQSLVWHDLETGDRAVLYSVDASTDEWLGVPSLVGDRWVVVEGLSLSDGSRPLISCDLQASSCSELTLTVPPGRSVRALIW